MKDYQTLCQYVIDIVETISIHSFDDSIDIKYKGKGNYLTTTDLNIEQQLIKQLSKIDNNIGFISEESDENKKIYNWIIDPIDGTTNYISHLPYTTSIALEKENEILLGVVFEHTSHTLYYAIKGKGSFMIKDHITQMIHVKTYPEDEGLILFGMPYDRNKTNKILNYVETAYAYASDMKRLGPASLDICRVAKGQVKCYFELDLKIWDYAAAALILKEAGGCFKQIDDLYLFYNERR